MIVRLTEKVGSKVKAERLLSLPVEEPAIMDWSAQSFMVGRIKYLLISNSKTLYSCVTPCKGINNTDQLVARLIKESQKSLTKDGFKKCCDQLAAIDATSVRFAKSLNRSVIGSMNGLIGVAMSMMTSQEFALPEVNADLNDTLLSFLGSGKDKYGKPKEAMAKLVSTLQIDEHKQTFSAIRTVFCALPFDENSPGFHELLRNARKK